MTRAFLYSVLLLVLAAIGGTGFHPAHAQSELAAAANPCAPPKIRTNIRPDPDGKATEVAVGIRMVDLLEINDVNQTITVDLAILRKWRDSRLANLEGCELSLNDIWFPELLIYNSGRLFEKWPKEVNIGPNGEVKYLQRISGTIASHHSLHEFPFDEQKIAIQFAPLEWSLDELKLSIDNKVTGMSKQLNISDWIIDSVEAVLTTPFITAFEKYHSGIDFIISAHRIRSYYVWKVILPLCLIVFMSWCVFWINPAQFGPQIGLSATAMLTLIAFIFAATNMVPALGYFTLLDLFIGGATILVFLALLESLTTSYLVSREKNDLAKRIDRVCRVLFPLSFAAIAILVFAR